MNVASTTTPGGAVRGTRRRSRARRRRIPRRTFRFTRQGKLFLLVTFGVGLAAVNTGNNLLYLVLGLMLSLLLVSGTLSDVTLWRVRVRRRVPRRAFVGRPASIELHLQNDKRLPSYAIDAEETVDDALATSGRGFVLKLEARRDALVTATLTPRRRGPLVLDATTLRTRFPFGLIEKGRLTPARDELLVYPAIHEVDARAILAGAHGLGAPDRARGHAEPDGLREHRDGDGARDIHWRRSASLGRLVVRERASETRPRLSLVLDDAAPRDPRDAPAFAEGFEVAVSEVASLAHAAHRALVAVEVCARGGASPLVAPDEPLDPLLRWLARIAPSDADVPLPTPRGGLVHVVRVVLVDPPPPPSTGRER